MEQPGKNRVKIKFWSIKVLPILSLCILFLNSLTRAQQLRSVADTAIQVIDTSEIKNKVLADSTKSIPISNDKLQSTVAYEAKDSIVYDAKKKMLYLHQGAVISYEDMKVNSDFIVYEQDSNRLTALQIDSVQQSKDSSVVPSRLSQGTESSTFTALKYNFKSKRALVENAYSQYGDGFIISNQVKRNKDETINGYKNIYTTCSDPHPHFGIGAKRIKIIPNKVAVSGSANLIIEDIPTPLFLPFGLFPLKKGQRSGFILPTYSVSESVGFGLRGGGYYFALNDHYDLKLMADVYTLGSWTLGAFTNYIYRYRFNGNFGLNFAYNKIGESYEPGNINSRDFSLTWRHTVDPKVLVNSSFSANVNIRSSKYNTYNTYDANSYLQNSLNSNISYSKNWPGKPFSFSAAARHSQNTQTRRYDVTLPELNFNVNQIYPFQFRKDIIKPRWYEKITASYNAHALNMLSFYDSSFSLNTMRWDDFNNGLEQGANVGATYNVLKYFNWTINADYHEYWYTKKFFQQYDFQEEGLRKDTLRGFYTARSYSATTALSTRFYGIKLFKKGWLRGIRHVLTPSINLRYNPNFGALYYYTTFSDKSYNRARLSYFSGSVIGGPGDGKLGGIGFNLGNTLQMKVRSKKDTLNGVSKINLIDGLDFSSFYNLAVDSFQWQNLGIGYRTTLLPNIQLSGNMSYSFYALDSTTGKRINQFYFKSVGKPLRFENASLNLSASLPVKKNNSGATLTETQKQTIGNNYSAYADFNIPWTLRVNYGVRFNKNYLIARQKDTLQINHDLIFSGDINLTSKWKIGFNSGYDFKDKKLKFTTFDIYRDLHCWEMHINMIPFGLRKSYNFTLNVKSAVLQDLKLVRRKDFRDFL